MKTANSGLIMGGKGEVNVSECKSVTSGNRNPLSTQDEKRGDLKGRRQAGKSASGDKKNENGEPSNLTYTSEEDVYYEPGGKHQSPRNLSAKTSLDLQIIYCLSYYNNCL